ncbi:MAG: PIN domain-containing protein [Pirellulales bacterium]|nr:PIN domain-containing protein [Pirellulales bacterium]
MKVFFDTSVLVAACIESHPEHIRSFRSLQRVKNDNWEMVVATHTLAELYAVLTRVPIRPQIAPAIARRIIKDNVETIANIKSISTQRYKTVLDEMASRNLSGGIIYDALAASIAVAENVDVLLTLNRKDFLRVWSLDESIIREP